LSSKNLLFGKISILKRNLRDASLHYLNLWEFFSFLVNEEEINNQNIIEYFKPNLVSGTDDVFEEYEDIKNNQKAFEEIRQLHKKLGY
jgi:competence protein ComGF